MSRYLIVRFGDNDFSRCMKTAAESFILGFHGKSPDEIYDQMRWVTGEWLEYFYRAAVMLDQRAELANYTQKRGNRDALPDYSVMSRSHWNIKYRWEEDLSDLNYDVPGDDYSIWENGEVCIIDLEKKTVRIV